MRWKLRPPNSLRFTMVLALVLGLVGPSWFSLRHEKAEVQAALYADLLVERDRYGDILERTIGDDQSKAYIDGVLALLMLDTKIRSVTVTHPDGRLIATMSREIAPDIPVLSATRNVPGTPKQGQPQGDVAIFSLELSTEIIYQRLDEAEKRFYTRTAWTLAATLGLLSLVFYIGLVRPVDRLVRQSRDIAKNRLSQEIVWNRNDEIGRVGQSLEDTRQALAALIGSMEQVNRELTAENQKRRAAEASVAAYANELEHRVEARTRELSAANDQLAKAMETLQLTLSELVESEKMASLGRLVAGVAHELNTPLGNALTVATSFQDGADELAVHIRQGAVRRSTLEEFLSNAMAGSNLLVSSIQRAAGLVQSFKQLAANQQSEQRRTFTVNEIFDDVTHQVSEALRVSSLQLITTPAPGIELDSYPDPLKHVIGCLVKNAMTHAFAGRTEGCIYLSARAVGEHAVDIECHDTGVGIPAENLTRVFDPFFTSRLGQGSSGLGLAIVHSLVTHVLGGRITATSTLGSGSRFTVHVPLKAPDLTTRHRRNP